MVLDARERVVAVGPSDALRAAHPERAGSSTRAVLMPGLVNAHTHLELSGLRGRVPGGRGFAAWVSGMLDARARAAPEQDVEAIDAAVSELLAAGTAAVGEVTNTLAAVDALAQCAARSAACSTRCSACAARRARGDARDGRAAPRASSPMWPAQPALRARRRTRRTRCTRRC